jgi:DivIVA domain-containing protein
MIDLTPLDVRKKKGDFRRGLRGYEQEVVDSFLDLVADRLEELVRENLALRERVASLQEVVGGFRGREQAMNEALVSAQQLREEIRQQAGREAELLVREARAEGERIVTEARREASVAAEATRRLHAEQAKFLRAFRALVERQLAELELEEEQLLRSRTGEAGDGTPHHAPGAGR